MKAAIVSAMRGAFIYAGICVSAIVSLAYAAGGAQPGGGLPLTFVVDVGLPGPANRFDYQSRDPRTHRLYIAHLAASSIVVVDTETRKVIGEINDVSQVHGVLAVAESNKVYASATGANEIAVIDGRTLKIVGRVPTGAYPDGLAYAPEVRKIYVSDQRGRSTTVIDTQTDKRVATLALEGEAGNSQYDPISKHIFVNVQTRNDIAEIDPATDKIVARHPLNTACRNHGLLIEPTQRVAFIACEDNAKLLTFDMNEKKVNSSAPVGVDPDVLAFDAGLNRLYVAAESGVVSVFRLDGKTLTKLGEAKLAANAHTVAVESESHLVYFPLQNVNGKPVLRIMSPAQ
jgi:DNA-binding beta-propeller fold protein YncE